MLRILISACTICASASIRWHRQEVKDIKRVAKDGNMTVSQLPPDERVVTAADVEVHPSAMKCANADDVSNPLCQQYAKYVSVSAITNSDRS